MKKLFVTAVLILGALIMILVVTERKGGEEMQYVHRFGASPRFEGYYLFGNTCTGSETNLVLDELLIPMDKKTLLVVFKRTSADRLYCEVPGTITKMKSQKDARGNFVSFYRHVPTGKREEVEKAVRKFLDSYIAKNFPDYPYKNEVPINIDHP